MSTPTRDLSSALAWLEMYACARFVTQCLPSAKYLAKIEGSRNDDCYEVRSESSSLFRFYFKDDFTRDRGVFFSLDLQGIIDEIKQSGQHEFYERTLREAMDIHLDRLSIQNWETFETLYLCCKLLVPVADEAAGESEPLDVEWFGSRELSGVEILADSMIRKFYVAPYPEVGNIGAWKSRLLRDAIA